MDDVAIKVDSVSKTFKLPHEKQSSIKGLFLNIFKGKRTYEKQEVLKDISFEIKKGEFFGIVGRNGSGKSTLLKLLAGIYSPDKGHIQVNGKLTPFIELGVGFNPELTGRENVFLNGALLGFGRKEMESMYDEIVEFAELEKFMDQKLKNYSSGMQVRLAFSIAIQANAEILVLDEVLAVGDEAFQRKCNRYFDRVKKQGKTIVLVTHSMDNVRKYCDKAMLIKDGKIVTYGSPEDVSNEYSMENLRTGTSASSEAKKTESLIKDLKVELSPEKRIIQDDRLEIKISYRVLTKIPTRVKVSILDIDRNTPLFAADSPVIKKDRVSITLFTNFGPINDTNMKVSVSIRDKVYNVLHFLPDNLSPTLSLKRTDYRDSTKKTTWALLFSRGEWKE